MDRREFYQELEEFNQKPLNQAAKAFLEKVQAEDTGGLYFLQVLEWAAERVLVNGTRTFFQDVVPSLERKDPEWVWHILSADEFEKQYLADLSEEEPEDAAQAIAERVIDSLQVNTEDDPQMFPNLDRAW